MSELLAHDIIQYTDDLITQLEPLHKTDNEQQRTQQWDATHSPSTVALSSLHLGRIKPAMKKILSSYFPAHAIFESLRLEYANWHQQGYKQLSEGPQPQARPRIRVNYCFGYWPRLHNLHE